jgi:hypothetical protein
MNVTTTAGTATSTFVLSLRNNGGGVSSVFTVNGDGSLQFNRYGIGTFDTVPAVFYLGVDASGNVVETPVPAFSVSEISTNWNESATSGERILLVTTPGSNVTINLPPAVGNTAKITIKKIAGSNSVIVDPNASETIDGGATATIQQRYESITLVSNNSNWFII